MKRNRTAHASTLVEDLTAANARYEAALATIRDRVVTRQSVVKSRLADLEVEAALLSDLADEVGA